MKKVCVLLVLTIVICVLFSSCGNSTLNNNATDKQTNPLIGTWFGEVNGMTSTYTFEENGIGTAINNAGTEIPFTYQVIDDTSLDFEYTINGEKISETSTYILDGDTLTLDEVEFVRQ